MALRLKDFFIWLPSYQQNNTKKNQLYTFYIICRIDILEITHTKESTRGSII